MKFVNLWLDRPLVQGLVLLLIPLPGWSQEEAPVQEYPYPQKIQTRNIKNVEKPKKVIFNGTYIYNKRSDDRKVRVPKGVEQPIRVAPDGTMFYDTDKKADPKKSPTGVVAPNELNEDGSYFYHSISDKKKDKTLKGVTKPRSVHEDGTYDYALLNHDYKKAIYFRMGIMGPFNVRGSRDSSISYKDIYTDGPGFGLNFEHEWLLTKASGRVTLKFSTGFNFAEGKGIFAESANDDVEPRESYQFVLFPNTLFVKYKFEYGPEQTFVPYVEGGLGYFTFIERRTDGSSDRFGGAPTTAASVGLLIALESLGLGADPDDGYNRSWFDIQFRQILGLDQRKDFTSSAITLGISLGY